MTVADFIVRFLGVAGVRRVFGYPGSPLVPLLAALQRQQAVGWVLTRHENAAAMAAGADARLTGRLGVCMATSGPGVLNAVCGMVDADLDRVPLLLVSGLVPTAQLGHWEFQDVDQARLLGGFIAESAACVHPAQLAALLRNFVGRALQQQRAVHLALPSDVLEAEVAPGDPAFRLDAGLLPRPLALMPPPSPALDLVARELDGYRRPAIVVGRRAAGAGPAIERLAERLGAPIITTLDGKGIIDEAHPNARGVLGVFGFPAFASTGRILSQADAIVAMGVDTIKPFLTERFDIQHRPLIQCDADFGMLSQEYHRDRTLLGPLDAIADGLCERLRARPAPTRRAENVQAAEAVTAGCLHPRTFLGALGEHLPAGAVVALDTGAHTLWVAHELRLARGQRVVLSSHLGTMGFSLPAAIAAQLAEPGRAVVAICGDGGFQMVASELGTAVAQELPITVVIFNNGVLQNVSAQQAVPFGTTLANPDFVMLARAYGAEGVRVDATSDLAAVLHDAFHRPRRCPMLIDLRVDPAIVFPLSKWEHLTPAAERRRQEASAPALS